MNDNLVNQNTEIWAEIVQRHLAGDLDGVEKLLQELLSPKDTYVGIIRRALHGHDRLTALYILNRLPQEDIRELFEDLVWLVSFSHGSIQRVRDAILSLPHAWVVEHVERAAEPLLTTGTYDEYRRFLELYILLDRELTIRLARRAAAHADPDVKEAGEEYLERLSTQP